MVDYQDPTVTRMITFYCFKRPLKEFDLQIDLWTMEDIVNSDIDYIFECPVNFLHLFHYIALAIKWAYNC